MLKPLSTCEPRMKMRTQRRGPIPTPRLAAVNSAALNPDGNESCEGRTFQCLQIGALEIRNGTRHPHQNNRTKKAAPNIRICLASNSGQFIADDVIYLIAPKAKITLNLSIPVTLIERHAPYFKEFLIQDTDGGDPQLNNLLYQYIDEFLMRSLRSVDTEENPITRCIEDHIVHMVVSSLETQSDHTVRNLSKSRLRLRVKDFINQNLDDPALTPQKIAEACGISLSYLHKIFTITDTSVCRWILQQRLNVSKQRLSDPAYLGIPISRIAYDIGFNNQAHFSSKFKQQFGISPKEVRMQAQATK